MGSVSKSKKKAIISVAVDESFKQDLSEMAQKRLINRSVMIRSMIEQSLSYDGPAEACILVQLMNELEKLNSEDANYKAVVELARQLVNMKR
jgi:hypothetical protein